MWSVTQGILEISVYDCKLYVDFVGFLLLKTVQLTAFYGKMTWNVWLDRLPFSLYVLQELTVNLLRVFFFACVFTIFLQLKLHYFFTTKKIHMYNDDFIVFSIVLCIIDRNIVINQY